jgi:hypothetical protein
MVNPDLSPFYNHVYCCYGVGKPHCSRYQRAAGIAAAQNARWPGACIGALPSDSPRSAPNWCLIATPGRKLSARRELAFTKSPQLRHLRLAVLVQLAIH